MIVLMLRLIKKLMLCTVNLNEEIYEPDEYTRKQLIRKLIYQKVVGLYNSAFKTRRAIPAFNSYEKIAVELRNIIGIGFDCRSRWKIISPISLESAKKIAELFGRRFCRIYHRQKTRLKIWLIILWTTEKKKILETERQ